MDSFRLMLCTRYYGFYTNIETHRSLSPSTDKDVSSVQTDRYFTYGTGGLDVYMSGFSCSILRIFTYSSILRLTSVDIRLKARRLKLGMYRVTSYLGRKHVFRGTANSYGAQMLSHDFTEGLARELVFDLGGHRVYGMTFSNWVLLMSLHKCARTMCLGSLRLRCLGGGLR
ncbi:hypothetical protein VN97_g2207 [Penicillium thymicola]|uniref:Uncharacterized protein n=1 Tax=Penicillium thymicola TaxID=293382 RepID=A0AAI9TPG8_PENTH|nr:hypothetical protein VN97_g2207 [Penicillium thymicola]